jgi:rubrerythrin
MTPKFQRRIENFTCEQCGESIVGNGYTNHCPRCLWSKHVDIHPGDRAADCGGLMEPVGAEQKSGETIIIHRCIICGHMKPNCAASDDNFDLLIELLALGNTFYDRRDDPSY